MGLLNIVFTEKDEEPINECVKEFNELCDQGMYPKILELTHYELAKISNITDPAKWKKFLLNPKVKDWYQTERAIILDSEVQKLIRTASSSGSTATVQALNSLLAQQKSMQDAIENKTVIIYNFVDLTDEEKENPLINESKTIPAGIRRAIRYVEDPTNNNEK